MKYLIGITPHGFISFISEGYSGRVTDKYITEDCGILENLLPGDIVLADHGFTIHELVASHYATLNTPAIIKGLSQLHLIEVEKTRKIASVRIHVERIISLLRNKFNILKGPLPISILKYQYGELSLVDIIIKMLCSWPILLTFLRPSSIY